MKQGSAAVVLLVVSTQVTVGCSRDSYAPAGIGGALPPRTAVLQEASAPLPASAEPLPAKAEERVLPNASVAGPQPSRGKDAPAAAPVAQEAGSEPVEVKGAGAPEASAKVVRSPPTTSHAVAGKEQCTMCHHVGPNVGSRGGTDMPATHGGYSNSSCLGCHPAAVAPKPDGG